MRKWTYLVATLLMAGTTATFTGCIDTDEPEGIVDLRGAKSELIKAQAAVKLVEVEWQKAQVAYQELVNKSKELDNQYKEYDVQMHALDVKLKELEVERAQAATEQAKAEAEAKIAEANRNKAYWENKMAEEAEIFKAAMLNYQTQTAQAQEANVAAVSEQFDTTAPVVESISIDKQGQNVGDDDTFKIAIKAYDSDSGIQDVRMVLESEGNNTTYYYSYADGSLQYNEAAKSYEYAVKVSDAELTDGKVFIDTLTVTDKAGNSSSPVLSSTPDVLNVTASSALYWVNITRSDNEKPVVTSVKLKENGQTVKQGDTLHVTIGATDNSALQDTCYVEFQVNAGNTAHSMYLQWDSANGCYIGSWELPDDIVPGEWYINGINVKDVTGNRAEKNSAWDCKVTVQNDNYVVNEKNVPKLNSFSMDKAGQTFTAGDQVKFTADITDDTGVASVKIVLKNVNSELSSKDDVDCYMQNVEGTSKYEYTYTITENDYPCEWYVSSIEARDVYNNMLYTSTERQTSGRELPLMYDYYFNVTQNGTFVQPNVNVMFSYINADMEWDNKTIEVPRRTKLSKAFRYYS